MSKQTSIRDQRGVYDGFANYTYSRLIAQAEVEAVAAALSKAFDVTSHRKQITSWPCPGEPLNLRIGDNGKQTWDLTAVCVAQLVGHSWTQLLEAPGFFAKGLTSPLGGRQLSKHLDGDVLLLAYEDVANFHAYEIFRNGESVEYYDGGWGDERFRSSLGRKPPQEIQDLDFDGWQFIDNVLVELDACIPMAHLSCNEECDLIVFGSPEDDEPLNPKAWERVDLLTIKPDSLPTQDQAITIEPARPLL